MQPHNINSYGKIDWYPSHNGGWYTGEPFAKGAPYGNITVIPDTAYLIETQLASAGPPPGAAAQYPGFHRPGNNTLMASNLGVSSGFICSLHGTSHTGTTMGNKEKQGTFSKYLYL